MKMNDVRPHESGAEGRLGSATPDHEEARPAFAKGWDEPADLTKPPAPVPEPADVEVPAELRAEIEAHMARYPDIRSATLPALFAAQRLHGWCSPQALEQVAAVMGVTPAYLESITTFYDMYRNEPVGSRYVYVCTGVACSLRRARIVYKAIAEAGAELDDVEIREFECLGACDMAPMASIDGRYVGPLGTEDAEQIVDAIRAGREVLPGRGLEGMPEAAAGRWSGGDPIP